MITLKYFSEHDTPEYELPNSYSYLLTKSKSLRRRSQLFIPITKLEKYKKHILCGADTIIFDLEDSIPSNQKDFAREQIAKLPEINSNIEYLIRINSISSAECSKDINALKKYTKSFHGISIPKIEEPSQIQLIRKNFPSLSISAICETPRGVNNAFQLAETLIPGDAMGIGASDLALSIGVERTPIFNSDFLKSAMIAVSSAAHQYKIDFIDTICRWFDTVDGLNILKAEANWAKLNAGAIGKRAIHPSQVSEINQIFTPTYLQVKQNIDLLTHFDSNLQTRAIKLNDDTYFGAPEFNLAQKNIKSWFSKGYITNID